MRLSIRDHETLAAVKPLEALSYLRSKGWKKAEHQQAPDRVSVWLYGEADEFECAVPLETSFRDYALRIADVLKVLEVVEGRSQLEVHKDLMLTSADVIRVRLQDPELSDGSVPLDEGAEVFHQARDMLQSAACSAVQAKAYFPSRKPDQVLDYLRHVRLGQTEHGSFVLTIISRVPPALGAGDGQLFDANEEPFERRATQCLARALQAVKVAARDAVTHQTVDSFVDRVGQGVSANLCDALVGMAKDQEGDRSLEFSFGWSANRPVEPGFVNRVAFTSDAFPAIREAARHLKRTIPLEDFELQGPVVKLDSTTPEDSGKVTVAGLVDGEQKKITFILKGAEYTKAVEAHRDGNLVRCSGVLSRDGRRYKLDGVSRLQTVEDAED